MSSQLIADHLATDVATVTRVHLLGGFRVTVAGEDIDLPSGPARLLAFLALHGADVDRSYAASSLWLDKSEARAQANLRSCLWRLRHCRLALVASNTNRLRLAPSVQVDLDDFHDVAARLIDPDAEVDPQAVDSALFCAELLPDWYDDFVIVWREQLRQLRLYALERFAQRLHERGATARALQIGLTAVAAEPLRESAHRVVMSIHLDEGNVAEALRQYHLLQDLLRDQLGVTPSPAAREIVAPLLAAT